jgi:hypothetical protein
MRIFLVTALLLSHWANAVSLSQCQCTPVSADEVTGDSGNVEIVVTEKRTLKSVHGKTCDPNGTILEGVLIEVYTDAHFKRIAACKTGADGKFCFKHIPAGKYRLIGSMPSGMNNITILIKVNPKSRKSSKKRLEINMYPAG